MKFFMKASIGLVLLLQFIDGEDQCGKVDENQLYTEDPVAAMDEYPWIARIYYKDRTSNSHAFHCAGVLISRRHVLTALHCIGDPENRVTFFKPEYVLLGDSDYGNLDTEQDCNIQQQCAPLPKKYAVYDVVLHPKYDERKRIYDIALIHLVATVEYNDYVQPICLPPPDVYTTDFLGQYFAIAGFLYRQGNVPNETKKTKSVAHVVSTTQCAKILAQQSLFPPSIDDKVICTSFVGEYAFMSGSILMGVNVVNAKLKSLFLLGILSDGDSKSFGVQFVQYNLFTKISPTITWLRSNMKYPRKFQNATVWI